MHFKQSLEHIKKPTTYLFHRVLKNIALKSVCLNVYFLFQECCKWSAQNPGKVPDPWYKLNFRPKPLPPKPKPKPKPVKEKKEKELTKKQKEKLEKVRLLFLVVSKFAKTFRLSKQLQKVLI